MAHSATPEFSAARSRSLPSTQGFPEASMATSASQGYIQRSVAPNDDQQPIGDISMDLSSPMEPAPIGVHEATDIFGAINFEAFDMNNQDFMNLTDEGLYGTASGQMAVPIASTSNPERTNSLDPPQLLATTTAPVTMIHAERPIPDARQREELRLQRENARTCVRAHSELTCNVGEMAQVIEDLEFSPGSPADTQECVSRMYELLAKNRKILATFPSNWLT
jgi:hypothetical protein